MISRRDEIEDAKRKGAVLTLPDFRSILSMVARSIRERTKKQPRGTLLIHECGHPVKDNEDGTYSCLACGMDFRLDADQPILVDPSDVG